MSLRNTPNVKFTKSLGASNAKLLSTPTVSASPNRATISSSTTKKTSMPLQKPKLIKQSSACDLRDRLNVNRDDVLNTAFAETPPLSRAMKLSAAKSKSTTTINAMQTPSALFRSSASVASNASSAMKILPSTPRSIGRRLFGTSTSSLSEAVASRTPECFSKVAWDTPTPRAMQKFSFDTPRSSQKNDDSTEGKTMPTTNNSEISNLTVAVRVRPMNTKECTTPSVINVITVDDKEITVLAGTNADSSAGVSHSFLYDYAFWSCNENHENFADQETVFKGTTMPLIDQAFEGYNACLFAYGQTGSGKSYSMMGIDTDDDLTKPNREAGIIPRFCHELFRRIEELKGKMTAEIEVSYFEIYNEKIHDLLAVTPSLIGGQLNTPSSQLKPRPALRVREHPTWGPYVVDLNTHPVDSHAALKNWLAVGNSQRATAATGMNDKSSRSHSIFNIILNISENVPTDEQAQNAGRTARKQQTKRSKISLVDLAGSERVSHTCASGERLKEGVSINKSLLTLGKVIAALADTKKNSFVPYRESVLTWLLRESLGGNSKTVMLATISPASLHLDETLATLRYACQARSIVNRVKKNEDPNDRQIRELRAEVERLQALQQDYERQKIHAVQAPPRKIIIETIDGVDENEKETLRQQLRETEQELIKAQKSWRDRLKEAENLRRNEMRLLQQNGLALELSVAQKQPCLINLATDPMLSGTLLYILPPGIVRIGRPKPSTHAQSDIVLDGPLVGTNHCQIENKRGTLYIRPDSDECETFVNGELITSERQIYHGDRVVIGGSHYFRISNPDCPRRSQSAAVDYQTAHQEILKEQETRLRQELLAETQAAFQEIEEEKARNEISFKEKVAKLELEQFRVKCTQELVNAEKDAMARNQMDESIFEYKPFQSNLMEKIRRIMEHPTDEGLHETQLKVKEATQRCRDLGLNYDFVQTQVADEFGLFKAVVNIIDKRKNRVAEWPTARLNVWLDLIRDNSDINARNVFDSVDISWSDRTEEFDLNESLNSSRISLNLSAMKDAWLGKPPKSCFKSPRSKLPAWPERVADAKLTSDKSATPPIQNTKKRLTYDDWGNSDSLAVEMVKRPIENPATTSSNSDQTFEALAQHNLRDMRKAALKLKKVCHQNSNENVDASKRATIDRIANAVDDIEALTNDIRRMLKDMDTTPVCKTPKSVRFILD